jgi:hypothetical protein
MTSFFECASLAFMKFFYGIFLSVIILATFVSSSNHYHEHEDIEQKHCSVCFLSSKIKYKTVLPSIYTFTARVHDVVSKIEFTAIEFRYNFLLLDLIKARGPPLFV